MSINLNLTHDPKSGLHNLANQSVVLHCNHYNIELQNTILLPEYLDGYEIQFNAAAEVASSMVKEVCIQENISDKSEKLRVAESIYKKMGLGVLNLSLVDESGGIVNTSASHYHLGWQIRFSKSEAHAHVLTEGFIAGIMTYVFNESYSVEAVVEPKKLYYKIEKTTEAKYIENLNLQKIQSIDTSNPDFPNYDKKIPCQDITSAVLRALPQANESGLIEAFGVLLTYLPSEYYGKISYRFEQALDKTGGIDGLAKPLLIESGHICGFNTFGGIMTSEVWNTLILPTLTSQHDWVYGMVSVINALGWGHWHINELVDEKKLVLRVYNSTEAIAYREHFGIAKSSKCYTAEGAAAAIMNLIYKGDIISGPELTQEYYQKVFKSENTFKSEETKCIAKGDEYCEFKFIEK
ncbi:MAG: hypothetical protein D8M58_20600 [Calditrichaeota bacterium]|nr:MAG: hypothetical protein DWQ03_00930 [Calditrichota bacterium]MBL1207811.1 hypothetical protein [Calditrichota bacterium]NOG47645.1 hypothetical protein [Calditrichota bacterium]